MLDHSLIDFRKYNKDFLICQEKNYSNQLFLERKTFFILNEHHLFAMNRMNRIQITEQGDYGLYRDGSDLKKDTAAVGAGGAKEPVNGTYFLPDCYTVTIELVIAEDYS